MSNPVVGIIGNHYLIHDDYPVHASGDMNAWAVREVSDALPIIILPDQNLVQSLFAQTAEWIIYRLKIFV